jgi:hypothetical protein
MNKKYKASFIIMAVMLFSMILFFQNCSKKSNNLNLGPTNPGDTGCTTCSTVPEVVLIVSKAQNGPAITSLNYASDSIYQKVTGAGVNAKACIATYGDAGCENSAPTSWSSLSSSPANWVYDSTIDTWQYTGQHPLLNHPLYVPASYHVCMYNPDSVKTQCVNYIISAQTQFVVSKTNHGASVATFSYASDFIYERLEYAGPHGKACIAAYIPGRAGSLPSDINACDSPTVGGWVTMGNSEWAFTVWSWNFLGWSGGGDHRINHSSYMAIGSYRTCTYNPDLVDPGTGVNTSFSCTNYVIGN